MRVVPKLSLALFAGMCVILAVNGYFRVRREEEDFIADLTRGQELIGRSLSAAVEAVWKSEGKTTALASLDAVNGPSAQVRVQWIDANDHDPRGLDVASLRSLAAGVPTTLATGAAPGDLSLRTYVPVEVNGIRRGTIALYEPQTGGRRFVRSVVKDTFITAAALAAVGAVLSFVMGQWLVGGPVRILVDKARRIGEGDFTTSVSLRPHDELGRLGCEINAMCDRLAATVEQLRHADRLATVGTLASGIAHELGTPLNVISARAAMVARGETDLEESREYARAVSEAAQRMAKIIRQLLQFARRNVAHKEVCDVVTLTRDSIALLQPLAEKRGVTLELVTRGSDPRARVDAGQLQQVVTNLVMNAIQAMPKGGLVRLDLDHSWAENVGAGDPGAGARPPTAASDGARSTEFLRLRVEDEGKGIAPKDVPHIFEPFFTTKPVGEGTGLGLAVAYGIVRDHGGQISVASRVDRGTVFSVLLPRALS